MSRNTKKILAYLFYILILILDVLVVTIAFLLTFFIWFIVGSMVASIIAFFFSNYSLDDDIFLLLIFIVPYNIAQFITFIIATFQLQVLKKYTKIFNLTNIHTIVILNALVLLLHSILLFSRLNPGKSEADLTYRLVVWLVIFYMMVCSIFLSYASLGLGVIIKKRKI